MFINKNRIPAWVMFNQPAGDGGSDDAGDSQDEQQNNDGADDGDDFQAPWEKDGSEFDADRAKTLIKKITGDRAKDRQQLEQLKAQVKQFEDAQLSEKDRLERDRDESKTTAQTKALEAARLRALIRFGLTEDDMEFLHGSTEEEVLASAERFAARQSNNSGGRPAPSARPRPRGGSDPTKEADEDDDLTPAELAAKIRQRHH